LSSRRRTTFTVALLTLVVGLLVANSLATGGVWFAKSLDSIQTLENRYYVLYARSAAQLTADMFGEGADTLEEFEVRASRGLLPMYNLDELGERLVERLRVERHLAWLSYADAGTGGFVGAWRRDDGAIVLNLSTPDRDGGRPSELVVDSGGRRTPFDRDLPAGYDPRERSWVPARARP
jgi:hypothetical protein